MVAKSRQANMPNSRLLLSEPHQSQAQHLSPRAVLPQYSLPCDKHPEAVSIYESQTYAQNGRAMEATAARMAARDRYGAFGEAPASPLQRFICTTYSGATGCMNANFGTVQACDPQNFEPNLALNLEITDLINSKKGSA